MSEDRGSRERHLERIPARHVGHERGFASPGRIDRRESTDDLVDVQPHVLAAVVAERDRLAGSHAVDRVVERVHEHPPAELSVGDDVEPAVDLSLHRRADGLVLQREQLGAILGALLLQDGRMAGDIETVDGLSELLRAKERAHRLGTRRSSRGPRDIHRPRLLAHRDAEGAMSTGDTRTSRRVASYGEETDVQEVDDPPAPPFRARDRDRVMAGRSARPTRGRADRNRRACEPGGDRVPAGLDGVLRRGSRHRGRHDPVSDLHQASNRGYLDHRGRRPHLERTHDLPLRRGDRPDGRAGWARRVGPRRNQARAQQRRRRDLVVPQQRRRHGPELRHSHDGIGRSDGPPWHRPSSSRWMAAPHGTRAPLPATRVRGTLSS